MILGYGDKRTESFANGERVRHFSAFERQAWRRLEVLDAAEKLDNLLALSSNRLDACMETARASSASA